MSRSPAFAVRHYQPSHEASWLRCRVLSFLGTQYYDDVKPHRTVFADPSIAWVAVSPADEVIGILDVEIDGRAATIGTIAVHPDHQGAGIASALLSAALSHLEAGGIATVDAWTLEDSAANRWYQSKGFVASTSAANTPGPFCTDDRRMIDPSSTQTKSRR